MKKTTLALCLMLPIFGAFQCFSNDTTSKVQPNADKDKLVGNIIKNALETYHFKNVKVDKKLSNTAFDIYIEKVDYGKQFLLKSEVEKLKAHQSKMHEQMVNGKHLLVDETVSIMNKRIEDLEKHREKVFKKNFDFTEKDKFESDPDKRKFYSSTKELEAHWEKVFKQATLTRYLSLKETEETRIKELTEPKEDSKSDKAKKDKKDKKDKKVAKDVKPATEAELIKKAHEAIAEQYKRFFTRLSEDQKPEYLERFFNSISNVYDPHTSYLPPRKKEDFDIDISGSLEGIGAVLQEDGDFIKVVTIVPGGAAWRQRGLEVDDVILAVGQADEEPVDLVGMRVDDAVRFIRGKKGTEVRLTVRKADGTRNIIPIVRDVVQIGATYAKSSVIEHESFPWKVGYIQVPKFYRDFGTSDKNVTIDVKMELERLKKEKVQAVILDLRNNGGGALEDARQMSGLFLKGGPIVQIKDHRGNIDILRDDEKDVVYDGPLIVMVNRFSASASEILAGALQDYGRAVIVGGEYTHGKGTVQAVLNLNQGPLLSLFGETMGALKVTIQKFYRINGESTQFKGITPDIVFPDPLSFAENREQDLDHALAWDKVTALNYKKWDDYSYNVPLLKDRSAIRVKSNARFQKVNEYVSFLKERRLQTKISLNMEEILKEEAEVKKKTESLKMEEQNKMLKISNYEASLRAHENVQKEDEEQWKEDFEQRGEEWVTTLRQDPGLEEAFYILDDILNTQAGKKLSMVEQQRVRQ